MFKSTVKIPHMNSQLTPVASEILSIMYRQSSLIFPQNFSTFSSVRLVDGRPEWGWSSMLILNPTNHSKTCVRLSASSLKAFWSISYTSVVVFPRQKQNLKQIRCSVQSDITISREELDNTGELKHKPEQPSTVTSAWLLTREGCNYTHLAGEHSTMIRKSSSKPVRFFLGPPSYFNVLYGGLMNSVNSYILQKFSGKQITALIYKMRPLLTRGQMCLHNAEFPHIRRQAKEFWVNIMMENRRKKRSGGLAHPVTKLQSIKILHEGLH